MYRSESLSTWPRLSGYMWLPPPPQKNTTSIRSGRWQNMESDWCVMFPLHWGSGRWPRWTEVKWTGESGRILWIKWSWEKYRKTACGCMRLGESRGNHINFHEFPLFWKLGLESEPEKTGNWDDSMDCKVTRNIQKHPETWFQCVEGFHLSNGFPWFLATRESARATHRPWKSRRHLISWCWSLGRWWCPVTKSFLLMVEIGWTCDNMWKHVKIIIFWSKALKMHNERRKQPCMSHQIARVLLRFC